MFNKWLLTSKKQIEKSLTNSLPKGNNKLIQAMRYSTLNQGKRLRPLLYLAVAQDLSSKQNILQIAAAIELIHCYSLIHDDLPCMDDDQFRRGKATCHIKFGEATALLAGDALLTLSFEILANSKLANVEIAKLAKAIGPTGMIQGQMIDINSKLATITSIKNMHKLKTGKLIETAILCACHDTKIKKQDKTKLTKLAQDLGLAFQITDDIKDATGSKHKTGKDPLNDRKLGRRTYVTVLGLQQAKKELAKVKSRINKSLISFEDNYYYFSHLCKTYFL